MRKNLFKLAISCAVLAPAASAFANGGTDFSDFTPLAASAGPTADESTPITFGNPAFVQRSIASRNAQLALGIPNTGDWDMNVANETGKDKGRYLFTPFESSQSGIQRTDLVTGQTDTIYISVAQGVQLRWDASFWTPWGTYITAEEEWATAAGGATTNPYGRLWELRNPLEATGIFSPVAADSNVDADLRHANAVPRSSHEGVAFDKDGNMYFIDELNGGGLFRYTPKAKMSKVMNGKADYFAAGQTAVLRVGDGFTPNATGAYAWIPFTDENGAALPGALTITDPNGITSVDARNSTDVAAYKGTDYQRPEDIQIQTVCGREYLYVATTTTNEVYRLDLTNQTITVFAARSSLDLATGAPVGDGFASPDNLAVDHDGNIYIVEDRNGGTDNDIWFAQDLNQDGDLNDEGEGLARWASNGTPGSEFTGLYFDTRNKRRAWVNIQHPTTGNDRTIEITIARGKK